MTSKRAVRIANASGFLGDRASAMREMVEGGPLDVVTGDYLAELTMMILGKQRAKNPKAGFAATFLAHLEPVLATVLERGIKVVVNAGGLSPDGLAEAVLALGTKKGLTPKIAVVQGDDLVPRLADLGAAGHRLANLESGAPFPADLSRVLTANAYLGAWGIVRGLESGADIVICPRVTDASLVVGPAAWWHGWKHDDWDRLAGAVAAGHIIECGAQATGGNYSSFQTVRDLMHPGFPLAEVSDDGSSVITKHPGTGGAVTVGTVTAQLVYEVSSTRYANPDVVTHLDSLRLEQVGEDRVAVQGARGSPPPETTKVAITLRGLFRNELTFAFVGLDLDEKIATFEKAARAALAGKAFDLEFQRLGTARADAPTQDEATVLLRVIASGVEEGPVSRAFTGGLIELGLASYPGLFASGPPSGASDVGAYWPALIPQATLDHVVILPDGRRETIPLPPRMEPWIADIATETLAPPRPAGETRRLPLGRVADARSGDKGSDANVGVWVKSDDVYRWLVGELTSQRLRELLPEAKSLTVERYEFPQLRALNFMVRGLLAGGAAAGLRLDRQGKALGEYLRSRQVDVPVELVAP